MIEQAVICPTTPLYDPSPVRQRNINVFLGLQLSYASLVHREPAQPTAHPRASSKIPKVHHILASDSRKIQSTHIRNIKRENSYLYLFKVVFNSNSKVDAREYDEGRGKQP